MSVFNKVGPAKRYSFLGFDFEAFAILGYLDEVVGRVVYVERILDFFSIYI